MAIRRLARAREESWCLYREAAASTRGGRGGKVLSLKMLLLRVLLQEMLLGRML
jgi:hypothetical protein